MLTVQKFKVTFFDREIAQAVDAGRRKALSRAGAILMREARGLISKKGVRMSRPGADGRRHVVQIRSSRPGEPPLLQTGLLKQFLFFGYDASSGSVVVGPARLNGRGDAPATLEYGGKVKVARRRAIWKDGHIVGSAPVGGVQFARIAPRPYMAPAFARVRDKVAPQFRNSISQGG